MERMQADLDAFQKLLVVEHVMSLIHPERDPEPNKGKNNSGGYRSIKSRKRISYFWRLGEKLALSEELDRHGFRYKVQTPQRLD